MSGSEDSSDPSLLPDRLAIQPLPRPPDAVIPVPDSKSITNRAMILAALAEGPSRLEGALFSDDTRVMADSLNRLGIPVRSDEAGESFDIDGQGGCIPAAFAVLYVCNSGTTVRLITALDAFG